MPRPVLLYVKNGFVESIDGLDSHFVIHEFSAETFVCGMLKQCFGVLAFQCFVSLLIGINHHVLLFHRLADGCQLAELCGMDDKTIECVADRDPSCLGVANDARGHFNVGFAIKVSVHNTSSCLDDGNASRVAHEVDESFSSTWNANIDIAHCIEQCASGFVGGRKQFHNRWIDSFLGENVVNQFDDGKVRLLGITSSLEDTGVSTLEAKREDIERNIGASLVDNAHHTKWNADATQMKTIGERTLVGYLSEW